MKIIMLMKENNSEVDVSPFQLKLYLCPNPLAQLWSNLTFEF